MGLFSSTYNTTKNIYPEKVVHENHKAPTEDSIRLAKEYEEKIEKTILEKILVQNNIVNYTVIPRKSLMNDVVTIKIMINGKEFHNNFTYFPWDHELMFKNIRSWMAELLIKDTMEYLILNDQKIYKTIKE